MSSNTNPLQYQIPQQKQPKQKYNINFNTQVKSGSIFSNCAEIGFINFGTSTVIINSALTLMAGAAFSINGNEDEEDETIYTYIFAPGGVNNLLVIRKFYI